MPGGTTLPDLQMVRALGSSPQNQRIRSDSSAASLSPSGIRMSVSNTRSFSPRGPLRTKGDRVRPMSVDEGLSSLVLRYYTDKLERAKSDVDAQLANFNQDLLRQVKELALSGNEASARLETIATHSKRFLRIDPFLSASPYRMNIAEVMKLKDRRDFSKCPHCSLYLNRLLLIISGLSRLMGYLVCSRRLLQTADNPKGHRARGDRRLCGVVSGWIEEEEGYQSRS